MKWPTISTTNYTKIWLSHASHNQSNFQLIFRIRTFNQIQSGCMKKLVSLIKFILCVANRHICPNQCLISQINVNDITWIIIYRVIVHTHQTIDKKTFHIWKRKLVHCTIIVCKFDRRSTVFDVIVFKQFRMRSIFSNFPSIFFIRLHQYLNYNFLIVFNALTKSVKKTNDPIEVDFIDKIL